MVSRRTALGALATAAGVIEGAPLGRGTPAGGEFLALTLAARS
ncbi:MAG TPA: hypothetical protein VKP66_21220 [Steroidobacteraceae bacterium]|nr:hypothetical protein [Steroidobacteraceae bacterium]